MVRSAATSLLVSLSLLLFAACGDEHSHDGADHLLCFGDEDAATAGTALLGDQGALKVHVLSTDPSPLIVGENTVVVRITDASDVAMTSATLTSAETWQRVHDHGAPSEVSITPLAGDGEFSVANMGVVHTGSWLFRFSPEAAGQTDFVEFNFGVECPAELNEL